MKRCSKCGEDKPLTEFHRRAASPDGYHTYCKVCKREYHQEWYQRNKESHKEAVAVNRAAVRTRNQGIVRAAKAQPCADCGVSYPPFVMDFDHVRGRKEGIIARMVSDATTSALLREIAKCDVVCSNCHRIRTHGRIRVDGAPDQGIQ